MTVDGPVNAWAGYILGVQLSPDEVFAFYERELGTLWWQRDLLRLTQLTAETDARVWCKASWVSASVSRISDGRSSRTSIAVRRSARRTRRA